MLIPFDILRRIFEQKVAKTIKNTQGVTMLTVFLRTAIIYFLLILAMRLMGKRQIGELEVSDLVTTLLISEIASLPITEPELPLAHNSIYYCIFPCLEFCFYKFP